MGGLVLWHALHFTCYLRRRARRATLGRIHSRRRDGSERGPPPCSWISERERERISERETETDRQTDREREKEERACVHMYTTRPTRERQRERERAHVCTYTRPVLPASRRGLGFRFRVQGLGFRRRTVCIANTLSAGRTGLVYVHKSLSLSLSRDGLRA